MVNIKKMDKIVDLMKQQQYEIQGLCCSYKVHDLDGILGKCTDIRIILLGCGRFSQYKKQLVTTRLRLDHPVFLAAYPEIPGLIRSTTRFFEK
jgi:hypothetical protein